MSSLAPPTQVDIYLLSDKIFIENLAVDRLLLSGTKPIGMLADNAFDKEQSEERYISVYAYIETACTRRGIG